MRTSESGAKALKTGRLYRCFLVRCRLEESGEPTGQPRWRFTVQQLRADAAYRSFTCLHDVAAHLEAELMSCGPLAEDNPMAIPEDSAVKTRAWTRSRGGEEERG